MRYNHWNQTGANCGVELSKTYTPWMDFYVVDGVGSVMVRTIDIASTPKMEFLAYLVKDDKQAKFNTYAEALAHIGVGST
jgi:hypothetical protein